MTTIHDGDHHHRLPIHLFKLKTEDLANWKSESIDSVEFISLWLAFSKSKPFLSDGDRLENLTWRLWQREQILNDSASHSTATTDRHPSHHPSHRHQHQHQHQHHHQHQHRLTSHSSQSSSSSSSSTHPSHPPRSLSPAPTQSVFQSLSSLSTLTSSSSSSPPSSSSSLSSQSPSCTPPISSTLMMSRPSRPDLSHRSPSKLDQIDRQAEPHRHPHMVVSFHPPSPPTSCNRRLVSPKPVNHTTDHRSPPSFGLKFLPLLSSPPTRQPSPLFALTSTQPSPPPTSSDHRSPPICLSNVSSATSTVLPRSPSPFTARSSVLLPSLTPNAITPSILSLLINSLLSVDSFAQKQSSEAYQHPIRSSLFDCLDKLEGNRDHLNRPFINRHPSPVCSKITTIHPSPSEVSSNLSPSSSSAHPDLDATPRSGSPRVTPFVPQLQPPPLIVNIAPTPPTASPAVTAPASPASDPPSAFLQSDQKSITTLQHLFLSPFPNQELDQPPSDISPTGPPSTCFDSNTPRVSKSGRPLISQRYSSGSTSNSSTDLKSVATSPSIQGKDDQLAGLGTIIQDKKSQPHDRPRASAGPHPSYRRATSTTGFKHKRRPISFARVLSHTSSRSVSPRLTQPREVPNSDWLDGQSCVADSSSSPEAQPRQSPQVKSVDSTPFRSGPGSNRMISTTKPSNFETLAGSHPDTSPSVEDISSCSLPSVVSPIIPVTPNNSQVSAPFQVAEGTLPHSLASSHATGRSSAFLPSAPPPTPAENGAPLPTTMSVGLVKSKSVQRISAPSPLPPIITASGAKKKAKFFIKEYEIDDDKLSPTSAPTPSANSGSGRDPIPPDALTPECIPAAPIQASNSPPRKQPINTKAIRSSTEEEDECEATDSDEWGSEYSDDECDQEDELAERIKLQELEKKRKQEEYHRELFAKKHFVQPNRSQGGSEQPPPIRRAGLSMLFHPELNHLQHHPRSIQRPDLAHPAVGPNRNYSAIELRQQGSASRKLTENPSSGAATCSTGLRSSIGPLPRPCSLIKSKSSVAVPVLAGQEPPAMVQRSPSNHSGTSSLLRQPNRMEANCKGSTNEESAAISSKPPPLRNLTHPTHRRHPSRLGGKPENVEYSDDDDDDNDGTDGNRKNRDSPAQMTEEQERRLGRLARAHTSIRSSSGGPPPVSIIEPIAVNSSRLCRPEPVAPPLSPRTTRRNMLANEMTESVRRNLLWERQMRAQALGIIAGPGVGGGCNSACIGELEGNKSDVDVVGLNKHKHYQPSDVGSGSGGLKNSSGGGLTRGSSSSNNLKKMTSNKEYRNFSKGFHRSGW